MRIFKPSLLFLLLALMIAAPIHAQSDDESTSVLDLLLSDSDYRLLVSAIAQSPELMLYLDNPDARVTVFAPTDAVFLATLEAFDIDGDTLLADPQARDTVLRHLIIPAAYSEETLLEHPLTYIMTLLPERGLAILVRGDHLYVNAVSIVPYERRADNGYLFVASELLLPPEELSEQAADPIRADGTLAHFLSVISAEGSQFSILAKALESTPDVLEQLTLTGPFTVYAPTDAAFNAYFAATGFTLDDLLANPSLLRQTLAAHIAPGHLTAATITTAIPLMGPHPFLVLALGGNALHLDEADGVLMVNGIAFTGEELFFENGLIHPIDGILDPFSNFEAQPAG